MVENVAAGDVGGAEEESVDAAEDAAADAEGAVEESADAAAENVADA